MASPTLELGLLLHTRHLIREGDSLSQVGELWERAAFAALTPTMIPPPEMTSKVAKLWAVGNRLLFRNRNLA